MFEFFGAVGEHAFLQNALWAGVLASIGCGVTGTYVVVRRIGLISGGIAHAVLGGMGVAYFFGREPLLGAVIAALLAAILISWISRRHGEQEDILISAVWAIGMAIGILFISKTPGYTVDLMSYLFGNVLLVDTTSLKLMALLDVVIVGSVLVFYKQLLATVFDEEFARVRGLRTALIYTLLLCMVALTVVLLVPVVGLVLVIALLTLPAAIAVHFVSSLGGIMLVSIILGIVFTGTGMALSYQPDLPAGATIIIVAGFVYLMAIAFANHRRAASARNAVDLSKRAGP